MKMATAFNHIALACDDPIAVERWYTKHFGFERKRVYAPGPGQVVVIGNGGVSLELFPAKGQAPADRAGDGAGPEYPGWRHVAFLVDDLDAKLREMGDDARITLGPLDMSQFIDGMRVAWISDPEGNIVELNEGYTDESNPPPLDR
jgi:glyoxylase I family protein